MFIRGQFSGSIDVALVSVPCPPLFSLAMAKEWKCKTDHETNSSTLGKFGHTITFKDTPYINVLDLPESGKAPDLTLVPTKYFSGDNDE